MIEPHFLGYIRDVFPPGLSTQQVVDLRRTFYAGVSVALDIMPCDSQEHFDLMREVTQFAADVRAGLR